MAAPGKGAPAIGCWVGRGGGIRDRQSVDDAAGKREKIRGVGAAGVLTGVAHICA